jgi:hypothetical protein
MAATPVPFSTKDNAEGLLLSTISPSDTSIPLESGDGAAFPQPYSGSATSGGTSTTLNCTGISATIGGSAQIGKAIWNATDGSVAFITAVGTNSLTTTRLIGGSDNTWQNSDEWRIDAFVLTIAHLDSEGNVAESPPGTPLREEILIKGRSTDTLTVATSGRGYNSTVAQQFTAGDSAFLFVTSPIIERFKDIISVIAQQQDTDRTTLATNTTNIGTLQDGTYHYAVATGSSNAYAVSTPALAAYTAGNVFAFKANFSNTGSATLNVNSLGAKTIKKNDGATNLSANDIINGQIVIVRYDGTNLQMLSPVGTPPTQTNYARIVYIGASDSTTLTNPTSLTNFDTHTYAISANDLINGVSYEFEGIASVTNGTSGQVQLTSRLGSTSFCSATPTTNSSNIPFVIRGVFSGTAAAGGSVAVRCHMTVSFGNQNGGSTSSDYQVQNVATNGSLTLQLGILFGTSNGSNTAILKMLKVTRVSTTAS